AVVLCGAGDRKKRGHHHRAGPDFSGPDGIERFHWISPCSVPRTREDAAGRHFASVFSQRLFGGLLQRATPCAAAGSVISGVSADRSVQEPATKAAIAMT